jgi:hypothetical protein
MTDRELRLAWINFAIWEAMEQGAAMTPTQLRLSVKRKRRERFDDINAMLKSQLRMLDLEVFNFLEGTWQPNPEEPQLSRSLQ